MFGRILQFITIFALLLFIQDSVQAAVTVWKSLNKGMEYAAIRVSPGIIHAFKIDPKSYKFGVVRAKDFGMLNASVETIAKKKRAQLAINGGFFTPEYDSLGLIINEGKLVNPVKDTSWWSIFYIKDDTPEIIHTKGFKNDPSINMAVQSGPRLVINGFIPKLKPSIAERSAICINKKHDVIIVATENLLIQPDELADYMRKKESDGGLGCLSALNLDGGSSTQLYANVGSFKLNVPGINKVANAIVVSSHNQ